MDRSMNNFPTFSFMPPANQQGIDPKTQALVQALLQQNKPAETPESIIGNMFQGVDPLSPQADAIRERAMQQYMNNSPFAPRGR